MSTTEMVTKGAFRRTRRLGQISRKILRIMEVQVWRKALLRHRVAAGCEHAAVLRHLPPLATVIDIGANRGQFSLVARALMPDAQLLAFEPLPGPAAIWRRVFGRDARARLIEAAIGTETGTAMIHVAGRDDSSSLLPITATQVSIFPGTHEVGTTEIRVDRLVDRINGGTIARPALLKIDVQGSELQVLVGCEEMITSFDWAYVECSFLELYSGQALADEVVAWLKERGFALSGVHNVTYDLEDRAVQADFLFERQYSARERATDFEC